MCYSCEETSKMYAEIVRRVQNGELKVEGDVEDLRTMKVIETRLHRNGQWSMIGVIDRDGFNIHTDGDSVYAEFIGEMAANNAVID